MRGYMLALAFVFLIACQPAVVPKQNTTPTVCSPPYYEYTSGDCCLDSEPNQVCDRYENRTIAPKNLATGPQQPQSSIVSDMLIKLRQNITGYSVFNGKTQYIVHGTLARVKYDKMQRLGIKINSTMPVSITDLYIDREAREAIGYCDPRREKEIMGEVDMDRSACAKIIDLPVALPYDEYNPTLPEDWLARFSYAPPILAETTDQYVKEPTGWKLVNPVLHFIENGAEYTLRLESKTGLPIRVEIKQGDKTEVISYTWLVHNSVKPQEVVYQKFQK